MVPPDRFPTIREPRLRLLLDHWMTIRRGRPLPSRRDIDPIALAPVLPIVWLCDYDRAADRFRIRLAGEEVQEAYVGRLAGRCLDELFPAPAYDALRAHLRRVIERPCILHARGTIQGLRGTGGTGERLVLPLAADGGADGIVAATALRWDRSGIQDQLACQDMIIRHLDFEGRVLDEESALLQAA